MKHVVCNAREHTPESGLKVGHYLVESNCPHCIFFVTEQTDLSSRLVPSITPACLSKEAVKTFTPATLHPLRVSGQ